MFISCCLSLPHCSLSFPLLSEISPPSPSSSPLLFPLHYIFLTSPGIKTNSLVPPNSPSQQFKTILLNNVITSISLFRLQQPPVRSKALKPKVTGPSTRLR